MCRVGLLLVAVLTVGLCQARRLPARRERVKAYEYVLPAGAEEIRDDINHSFVCANRTDGFYVDIDNDCQIFHRCQDRARFSFICAEKTLFSQMYQTCVHEGQLGYPCEDSAMFFPDGEGDTGSENEANGGESEPENEQAPAAAMPSQELMPPKRAAAVVEEQKVQVNSDVFDPVEDDESENTAHEVLDEQATDQEPERVFHDVEEENDNTQEIEVSDESGDVNGESLSNQEYTDGRTPIALEATKETIETNELDSNVNDENTVPFLIHVEEEQPEEHSEVNTNDVQTIEEFEPVALDIEEAEQHSDDSDEIIAEPTETIEHDANYVLEPELHNEKLSNTLVSTEPISENKLEEVQAIEEHEKEPLLEQVVSEIVLNDDSSEESPKKSESLVLESPTIEQVQDSIESSDERTEEVSILDADKQSSPAAVESEIPTQAVLNEEAHQESSLTSNQLPVDSQKSVLPEFIVSTVANLRKGVPAPPLRRRKTFLFKADAISS
ncbi:uncharacterized protein LOC129769271 isoform X2 [Toxorhynchites rutilus septentrionalis]|uniref:uncharacterized protein LOC129769271 isoform X2 n=1 Tax=Toxorhynchites rutilus septentrionalis TaxID=329112 RepID=UPI002479003F|nr:uncharacterized protein LOC129769271 isoform X2 [Toxorhynchites rutilus septentrionalis]